MAAIRREIKEVEAQLEAAEKDFAKINDKLRIVQQDRSNVEEELAAQNTRLKQMLDELALRKEQAEAEGQGHLIHPIHLIHSLWGNCHLQLPFLVPRCLLAYR